MFKKLYRELSGKGWKYHVLEQYKDNQIVLRGISMDPDGVHEVMKVKEIADHFFFHTRWDGQNIQILRHGER